MTLARETMPTFIRKKGVSEENADIGKTAEKYRDRYDGKDASEKDRVAHAAENTNFYYDLVTDFYEYGWGQAFHFAPRYEGESFEESLIRHEHYLALRAGWKAGQHLIDCGCGVGGPLRNIVRFTGAKVTGVNNNAYQVSRAKRHDERFGLSHLTDYVKCDFNNMPFADASIDGAYGIEATCHAADRVLLFKEILRVLKPGAFLTGYEWVTTDRYDAANDEHKKIKHLIEVGNGLPTLTPAGTVRDALEKAGFEIVDFFDMIERFETGRAKAHAWYEPLEGSYSRISGWRATPIGRAITRGICWAAETCRLTPAGAVATQDILEEAAQGLVRGGQLRIFTPSLFFLARKPAN